MYKAPLEESYLNRYEVAQYKTDLFQLFLQRGLDLLKIGGLFGYIVPNPWLTNKDRLCERSEPRSYPVVGQARCICIFCI